MNTAARALAQNPLITMSGRFSAISAQTWGAILLLVAVLASALAIVYVKELERKLFIQLQGLQQTRDSLRTEWGQLLLEQNTWAAPVRVQALAQQQLGMIVPGAKDIVVATLK